MPRNVSTNLAAIFAKPSRDIDFLIDITFPTIDTLRVATSKLIKNLIDYDNDIENVSELRQTLEMPIDRVNVDLQNKNSFYDLHTATNPFEWANAEAVIYRRYYNADHTVAEDVEIFRGGVESFPVSDSAPYQCQLQIIPDTISKGRIVANRTLSPPCAFVFKDPETCAYVGTGTVCDHHLKSGCTTYQNTHHFGGFEHRAIAKPSAPGSPTNDTPPGDTGGGGGDDGGGSYGGGSVGPNCPALDQFVLAWSVGTARAKLVASVRENDYLLNPITRAFERVKSAEVIENAQLFEVRFANGTVTKCSATHPLIRSVTDERGTMVKFLYEAAKCLTWNGSETKESEIFSIEPVETAAVMRIETDGPTHIYASGADKTKMVLAHNNKAIPYDRIGYNDY